MTRSWKPLRLLALSFALMFALLLAGCSDPALSENPASSENPAAPESPATPTSPATAGPTPSSSPASASSIEDAVNEATQLLSDLDQDFKED